MTAAERAALDAVKATVVRHTAQIAVVVVCLAVLSLTYCAGRSQGRDAERSRMTDSLRHVLADSSKAIEGRIKHRADSLVAANRLADSARASAHAAIEEFQRRVKIVSDSGKPTVTVSIDGGPPVREIPASIALPPIQTCKPALVADTVASNLAVAQLADMTDDRNTWQARALMDEEANRSRFGFKTGAIVGFLTAVVVKVILR